MSNVVKEDKHFKSVNKKRAFRQDRFVKIHKRENVLLREFEDLISAVEAGELPESVLNATSGQTADYVCEAFHQEKLKNGNSEGYSI